MKVSNATLILCKHQQIAIERLQPAPDSKVARLQNKLAVTGCWAQNQRWACDQTVLFKQATGFML